MPYKFMVAMDTALALMVDTDTTSVKLKLNPVMDMAATDTEDAAMEVMAMVDTLMDVAMVDTTSVKPSPVTVIPATVDTVMVPALTAMVDMVMAEAPTTIKV